MSRIKKILRKPEAFCLFVTIVLFLVIELQSGQFFTLNNITDLLAAYIVPGIMSIGCLIVFLSGGLDVSFPALGSMGVYVTLTVFQNYTGTPLLPFLFTIVFCGLLGAFNGIVVAKFKFAPLIVTLATESLFWGVLHGIIEARMISVLPASFKNLQETFLWRATNTETGLSSQLPAVFLILVATIVIAAFLLYKTCYGRKIYAVGGNIASAENIGINVVGIQVSTYIISGICAGVALLCRSLIIGNYHPNAAYGMEYNVIAMVVIGGCSLSGGKGTILGTVLGVILIQTMNNSLTLMNIPTYWQKFATGMIMILGISMTAYRTLRESRQLSGVMRKTETATAASEVK